MELKSYIGTKRIKAAPMNRGDYNQYRGWPIPENENPEDEGFLVKYSDDYESWSPKKAFKESYRLSGNLTFGQALDEVKKGKGMRLTNWSEDVVIRAHFQSEISKMTAPFLYVESRYGCVLWKEAVLM